MTPSTPASASASWGFTQGGRTSHGNIVIVKGRAFDDLDQATQQAVLDAAQVAEACG